MEDKSEKCRNTISYPIVDKDSPYNAEIEDKIAKRDKCFNIVFNDKDDREMKKLKAEGRWIFPENTNDDEQNNTIDGSKRNIQDKYKSANMTMTPHRLATNTDIKESMWYGLDWSDYGWIDKMNVKDNNLIQIDDDNDHKDKIKKLESDIDKKK